MSPGCEPQSTPRSVQRGMALISGLLLLVVITILAMSMFRSYGTQQKIAGNARDKQRATSAAVSAQQFGESWLASNSPPAAGDCTGTKVSPVAVVCANSPSPDFTILPWTLAGQPVGVSVTNFTPTVSRSPTQGTYYATPLFYVTDLGAWAGGPGEVYQVDATAYGGTPDAAAVVESTYLVSPSGRWYDK